MEHTLCLSAGVAPGFSLYVDWAGLPASNSSRRAKKQRFSRIGFSLCVKLVSGTTVGPANLFRSEAGSFFVVAGRFSGPSTG
jgi:hypothetical protein